MKKAIKALAAAVSAAVIAALPAANTFTASAGSAANSCNVDRTYILNPTNNPGFKSQLHAIETMRYNPDYSAAKSGMTGGSITFKTGTAHIPFISGSPLCSYIDAVYTPDQSTGLRRGIVMTFTNAHSSAGDAMQLGYEFFTEEYPDNPSGDLTPETVRVGDTSSYLTQSYSGIDGLTVRDALLVQNLVAALGKAHSEPGFNSYDRCINLQTDYFERFEWSYLLSSSKRKVGTGYYIMPSITLALLAADINNDGWVTPADAKAIMRHFSNPDKYPNFMSFSGMSDSCMNTSL